MTSGYLVSPVEHYFRALADPADRLGIPRGHVALWHRPSKALIFDRDAGAGGHSDAPRRPSRTGSAVWFDLADGGGIIGIAE